MVNLPTRIQLHRRKGWRLPPGTISVARPSLCGNPFKVGVFGDARQCTEEYRSHLEAAIRGDNPHTSAWFHRIAEILPDLRGHNLACYCASDAEWCHADVLLELANP